MEQNLFNLSTANASQDEGVVEVRPNLWLMSTSEFPPLLFTIETVGSCLSIDAHQVRDLIRQGEIRSVSVDGSELVPATAVAEFVAGLPDLRGTE